MNEPNKNKEPAQKIKNLAETNIRLNRKIRRDNPMQRYLISCCHDNNVTETENPKLECSKPKYPDPEYPSFDSGYRFLLVPELRNQGTRKFSKSLPEIWYPKLVSDNRFTGTGVSGSG